jgi:hypothetical protein
MKRRLLPAVALVLLLPTAVHTQQAAAAVNIHLEGGSVTLTSSGATSFGSFVNHVAHTLAIDPRAPTGDQSVASFTANGVGSLDIIVNFDGTVDLCHSTGCNQKIAFTPRVAASSTGSFCCPSGTEITTGATVKLNASGNHYFRLGGNVTTTAGLPPGVYSGLFHMRVAYP